jgi:hypothetical protein
MTASLPMGGQKITGMADPTITTDAATKNYVDALVASFFSTGDVKLTLKTVADTGWLMCDDQTIGSATSGASHQSINNQALFTLLFNNISDTYAPIYTSGGVATTRAAQGSVGAAWAANCQMRLTQLLGRALGISGAGALGLTARTLGQFLGNETVTLVSANLPPYTPAGTVANVTPPSVTLAPSGSSSGTLPAAGNSTPIGNASSVVAGTSTFTGTAQGGTSTAFGIMPPMGYLNAMIKL